MPEVLESPKIPKGMRLLKKQLGNKIYSWTIPEAWRDDHCYLYNFAKAPHGEKKFYLWKAWVQEHWPEPLFYWDRWSDLVFAACCGYKEMIEKLTGQTFEADFPWWRRIILTGAASCVHGNTRIYNPETGAHVPIRDLCEDGKETCVMTLAGPKTVNAPYLKGHSELFTVSMTDGTSFTATAEHRVLTPDGYFKVSELVAGLEILSAVEVRLPSTSDTDPSVHGEDAQNLTRTVPNSQSGCRPSPCFGDELLRSLEAAFQGSQTSPVDVLERTFDQAFEHSDGPENTPECIRPCPPNDLPSKSSPSLSEMLSEILASPLAREEIGKLLFPSSQPPFRSHSKIDPGCSFPSQDRDFSGIDCSAYSDGQTQFPRHQREGTSLPCPESPRFCLQSDGSYSRQHEAEGSDHDFGGTHYHDGEPYLHSSSQYAEKVKVVQAICSAGYDDFYDIEVPGVHHYLAEGVIHHNSGKSSRIAMWVLGNWIVAQQYTTGVLTSTSLEQLKRRIWAELVDWIGKSRFGFKDILEVVASDTVVRMNVKDTGESVNTKSAIFGRAVDQGGSLEAAKDRIKGIHNWRVFVVVDEMTAMPEAIASACRNLETGTKEFQFFGLGNATKKEDQHGIYAEPLHGWNSVSVDDEFWLTAKGGCCIHLDGYKSPGLEDPVKFHFYITRQKIEDDIRFHGGENSPEFWIEDRGFWPPTGLSNNVMDGPLLEQFSTSKYAVWKNGFTMCGAFDPAFEGGDRRVLYPFKLGEFSNGITGIELQSPIIVAVDMTQDKRWIHYQIADAVQKHCESYVDVITDKPCPILPENFMMDTSGEAGGLFSIMSGRWAASIKTCEFGGAPDREQMYPDRPTTWYETYANRVTMLWYVFRRFIEGDQIRGLTDPETKAELCGRLKEDKLRNGKIAIQPKNKMKGMKHKSPDKADACVVAAEFLRKRGIMPHGATGATTALSMTEWNKIADKRNQYFTDSYSDSEVNYAAH